MKFISWNVNGLRACLKKGFMESFCQLDAHLGCKIFGQPERPAVCGGFRPMADVCGSHRQEAIWLIGELERLTA